MLLGTVRSGTGTFTDYIYISEANLNQLVLMVGPSGFSGSVDNISITDVTDLPINVGADLTGLNAVSASIAASLTLQSRYALTGLTAISATQADLITLQPKTGIVVAGMSSASLATGPLTLTAYTILQMDAAVSLSQGSNINLNQTSFFLAMNNADSAGQADQVLLASLHILSVDNANSTSDIPILNMGANVVLTLGNAISVSQTPNLFLISKYALLPAHAVSSTVSTDIVLTAKHLLSLSNPISLSLATSVFLFPALNVTSKNRRPVKLRWVDWRYPLVHLAETEL